LAEDLTAVAAGSLRVVHRAVSLLEELARVGERIPRESSADAARDGYGPAVDIQRRAHRLQDALADQPRIVVMAELGAEDHELVSAQASDGIDPAGGARQPTANLGQNPIAGVVAE
jgi:hypothetical protein